MDRPLEMLPDSKIKQVKKLHGILGTWRGLEEQLAILQVSLENILEQERMASAELPGSFRCMLQSQTRLSEDAIASIPIKLKSKILQAKKELEAKISSTKQEFDPLQRQLYQLKLDISKSLSGLLLLLHVLIHTYVLEIPSNPEALQRRHGIAFSWEDIIRWTNEAHARLLQTISSLQEPDDKFLRGSLYGMIMR